MYRRNLWLLITCIPLIAWAESREVNLTHIAHIADGATTVTALSVVQGAVEANPLALPMFPISIYLTEQERDKECSKVLGQFQAIRWGATANNVLIILGAGIAAPLGLLVAVPIWQHKKDQFEECRVQALKRIFGMHANG